MSTFIGGRRAVESYTYRWEDGAPLLPYVVYHAADTGRLWDSFSNLELVEGTFNGGVYYSHFGHSMRAAVWRQRYGIDVEIQGAKLAEGDDDTGRDARREVVADPATIAMFKSVPSTETSPAAPQLGQFDAPVDPVAMIDANQKYDQRLVSFAGVNSADQMRMSGDPRSGYAVSVSRDAQRQVQRRYEPVFRRADEELLAKSAALLNRAGLGPYPEEGYRIRYEGIPLSPEERDSLRRHVIEQVNAGLLTRVQAYLELHPGVPDGEARRIISELAAERAARAPQLDGKPKPSDDEAGDEKEPDDEGEK